MNIQKTRQKLYRSTLKTHFIRCYRPSSPLQLFKVAYRDVYTLNPSNFLKLGQDWIDISSISHPTIRIFSSTPNKKGVHEYKPIQLPYAMKPADVVDNNNNEGRSDDGDDRRPRRQLWPPYSKGFLYFHSPQNRPRIAAELRLRLTPTNDASTFHHGKDLSFLDSTSPTSYSQTTHQPWRRPLYSIATTAAMRPVYEKLLEERLVPPKLDAALQALPKLTFMYSRCQIIHTLYDTFTFDLSAEWITLVAIAEKGLASVHLLRQFKDFRFEVAPYSGTVLARFEPSSLEQHSNSRTVVLRILQELTPIQCFKEPYDEYIQRPRPDHLFQKHFHGKLRPWSVDIDSPEKGKNTTEGLKLLWESTPGLKRR